MPIKLAKLDDLKARLDYDGALKDELLEQLIEAASALCAQPRFAGVDLRRSAGIVEYPSNDRHSELLRLGRFPIESIDEIKAVHGPGSGADFDAATPLVQDEDYFIESDRLGILMYAHGYWPTGRRSIRVTYTAGYGDPADLNPGELEPPADLQHGILQQCVWFYNTRGTAGLRELDAGDAGGRISLAESKPHADLVAACQRRVSI